MMTLRAMMEKSADADFLREMIGFSAQRLMELEVGGLTGAGICDWYLTEARSGRILGRRRRPIEASTLAMDRSRVEAHIKPLLGRRAVNTLKLGDIAFCACGDPKRVA